jgi:hypothetical protein
MGAKRALNGEVRFDRRIHLQVTLRGRSGFELRATPRRGRCLVLLDGSRQPARQCRMPAVRINTDAEVTIRRVDGTPAGTNVDLVTVGMVLGVEEVACAEQALNAKANCPVSPALAAVPEVNLVATLRARDHGVGDSHVDHMRESFEIAHSGGVDATGFRQSRGHGQWREIRDTSATSDRGSVQEWEST